MKRAAKCANACKPLIVRLFTIRNRKIITRKSISLDCDANADNVL